MLLVVAQPDSATILAVINSVVVVTVVTVFITAPRVEIFDLTLRVCLIFKCGAGSDYFLDKMQ